MFTLLCDLIRNYQNTVPVNIHLRDDFDPCRPDRNCDHFQKAAHKSGKQYL